MDTLFHLDKMRRLALLPFSPQILRSQLYKALFGGHGVPVALSAWETLLQKLLADPSIFITESPERDVKLASQVTWNQYCCW